MAVYMSHIHTVYIYIYLRVYIHATYVFVYLQYFFLYVYYAYTDAVHRHSSWLLKSIDTKKLMF